MFIMQLTTSQFLTVKTILQAASPENHFLKHVYCPVKEMSRYLTILIIGLSAACIADYTSRRIPNVLLAAIGTAGMTECYLEGGFLSVIYFILKTAAVIFLFYPVFRIGAVGAGDVKLIAICSGFLSSGLILNFLFFSMLTAAVFSIIKMCIKKNVKERFAYLCGYVSKVMREGRPKSYFNSVEEMRDAGLCMSGPVLCSILMHTAGVW
jgi:prepilin peptidase CpaA